MHPGSATEMYPCDGQPPQGREISAWERANFPWYMEFVNWKGFHNKEEMDADEAICRGEEPSSPYLVTILSPPDEGAAREFDTWIPLEPQYDGKVSCMEVQKAP